MDLKAEILRSVPWDASALDYALWLSAPVFRRRSRLHARLYAEAVAAGEERAAVFSECLRGPLRTAVPALGITGIRGFAETGEDPLKAHSFYVPATGEIEYDESFPGLIMAVQEEAGLDWFSPQAVEDSLIIHELFHHDETRRNAPVDRILGKKFGVPVPPVYRDIAAFACTNSFLSLFRRSGMPEQPPPKGPPCQLMDILWLYRQYPASCAAALERCGQSLFHNPAR